MGGVVTAMKTEKRVTKKTETAPVPEPPRKNPSGGYSCRKHNCYGEGDAGGRCPLWVREAIEAGYRSLLGEVRTVLYGEPLSVQAAEAFRARIAYAEELLGEGWTRHDLRIDGRISERRGYRYSAYFGDEVPAAEWKPFAELEAEMGPCAGEVFRG